MNRVFSLLVDNTPGVLSRISGLFSRRGYSIDSITAGVTADPRFTRITIVSSGDELILSQIEKQVRKLEDVIEIKVLKEGESVYRELIMVKVRANAAPEGGDHLRGRYFPGQGGGCGEGVPDAGADRKSVQVGGFLKSP